MTKQSSDKHCPKRTTPVGGHLPWRRDSVVLARLPKVERRHLRGEYNTTVAAALGVDEGTIRKDIKRLEELWLERTIGEQDKLRAQKVAELEDIKRRALDAAEWDQMCEQAVLFDDLEEGDTVMLTTGKPAKRSVYRDQKGSASFRGNKQGALSVARQAAMDQAKLLGLVTDKAEVSATQYVRVYERDGRS